MICVILVAGHGTILENEIKVFICVVAMWYLVHFGG
jgi:hypothetical protein